MKQVTKLSQRRRDLSASILQIRKHSSRPHLLHQRMSHNSLVGIVECNKWNCQFFLIIVANGFFKIYLAQTI